MCRSHHSNTRYDITHTYKHEFAYSLYPERAKYPWVGCSIGADGKGESVSHGSELFMAADSKMITIGGGLVEFTIDFSHISAYIPLGPNIHGSDVRRSRWMRVMWKRFTQTRCLWRPIALWLRLEEGMLLSCWTNVDISVLLTNCI